MNDYLIGWKIRWSPMLAPDQGMVPDASVFAPAEHGEWKAGELFLPGGGKDGECAAQSEAEKASVLSGGLWEALVTCEAKTSPEPEWIEQVCCHIEVMTAGAGERA
uniref:Uncharacterized protein n=1 Tax=Thermogemmatispora argillosa TaxID=2045280 RepID=A0A455T3X5_9CHLR|nr:hypothetical protein KTA_21510 [Thermogemmatispora argillosa]